MGKGFCEESDAPRGPLPGGKWAGQFKGRTDPLVVGGRKEANDCRSGLGGLEWYVESRDE